MRRLLIVPAAGLGSRLQASSPKALVPVNGRPMLDHLFDVCRPFVEAAAVVAHPSFSRAIAEHVEPWRRQLSVDVFEQARPTGMLDAILLAQPAVSAGRADVVWIVWCDQVGLLPATLARLAAAMEAEPPPALAFPTVWRTEPYIHFDRGEDGRIHAVRHRREGDAMPSEGEGDIGLFALSRHAFETQLQQFASEVVPGTATGERNFLPFIPWLAARDRVTTMPCTDAREAMGVNTPADLRDAEAWLRIRTVHP
jgi:bifunctional UDP-N-acetylglucosamine pyrophosphorylase/glucosamine-1-phosphate N-acetyltransferase